MDPNSEEKRESQAQKGGAGKVSGRTRNGVWVGGCVL